MLYALLATVSLALILGAINLSCKKGTKQHILIGRSYMAVMMITAIVTLFMKAKSDPLLFGHFGFIHLPCGFVLESALVSFLALKKRNIRRHKYAMISLYVTGIWLAVSLALSLPGRMLNELPGRMLNELFF